MDLISNPVCIAHNGKKRKSSPPPVACLQWNRLRDLCDRVLVSFWKDRVQKIVHETLKGVEDGVDEADGTGELDRRKKFGNVYRSLEKESKCPRLVILASDTNRTFSSAMKTIAGERDEVVKKSEPIIVAIQDAEQFPSGLLRDLVYTLTVGRQNALRNENARSEAQVCRGLFICSISSQETILTQLGIREISALDISTHTLPSANDDVSQLVQEVLLQRKFGIQPALKVYTEIQEQFYDADSTVSGHMRVLRMIIEIHYGDELAELKAFLAKEPPPKQTPRSWKAELSRLLKTCNFDALSGLDSVKKHVKNFEKKNAQRNSDIADFLVSCEEWVAALLEHRACSPVLERCIAIADIGEETSSGTQQLDKQLLRRIYEAGLATTFDRHSLCESTLRKLRGRSEDQLVHIFGMWEKEVSRGIGNRLFRWSSRHDAVDILSDFAKVKQNDEEATTRILKSHGQEEVIEPIAKVRRRAVAGASSARSQRAEKLAKFLKEQEAEEQSETTPRHRAMRFLAESLFHLFGKHVFPATNIPLHELVSFSDRDTLRVCLGSNGLQPRTETVFALKKPEHYGIQNADISAVYDVLSTSGRNLAFYEWLNAVRSIMENMKEDDGDLNGRFVRACADLEFLGFIRHSSRKHNSIQRLLFE